MSYFDIVIATITTRDWRHEAKHFQYGKRVLNNEKTTGTLTSCPISGKECSIREFSRCKCFYPLLSASNCGHYIKQRSSVKFHFQDISMHPAKCRTVLTKSLWSLDHGTLSSHQSPAQFVSNCRPSESIIWIIRYFAPRTFISFPSKSNIAVPICFGTFSSSSIARRLISCVFNDPFAEMD